jgi:uncharacterized membrane protein YtjA (UPF0391 family)
MYLRQRSFYSNLSFELQTQPDRLPHPGLTMLELRLVTNDHAEGGSMLYWALVFLIVAIIAAIFGFGGVAVAAAGIAKLLFFVFLVVFVITLITGLTRRGRTGI